MLAGAGIKLWAAASLGGKAYYWYNFFDPEAPVATGPGSLPVHPESDVRWGICRPTGWPPCSGPSRADRERVSKSSPC